jgi:predicted adenine nucleotide alpha hydrolase (AANH) superfamily ATPase
MKRLLVNACCGPCSIAVFNADWHKYFDEIAFFFIGDNFDTPAEFKRRHAALKTVMDHYAKTHGKITWIVADYEHKVFETCDECVYHRLLETAKYAAKNGYNCFSTTLTVSPYKDTDNINGLGRGVAIVTGVPFLAADLKENSGFKKSVQISRDLGLYRQKYCGCAESNPKKSKQ